VFGTFANSMRSTASISPESRVVYERALKRLLLDPSSRAIVVTPAGEPAELMAWAVASTSALAYVYVRHCYRRGKIGAHLGTALIEMATGSRSTPAAIWTTDASHMAANGFPIRYDLDEHEKFKQLAR
jgi:hypothetical protein